MSLRVRPIGSTDEDVSEEVIYWRKANQIRQWFVDHTGYDVNDNCVMHPVTKEDLEQLYIDCKVVLSHRGDIELAEEILPRSSGFFFGSTEYDDHYYEQLEDTVTELDRLFEDVDFDKEEICYHEWW